MHISPTGRPFAPDKTIPNSRRLSPNRETYSPGETPSFPEKSSTPKSHAPSPTGDARLPSTNEPQTTANGETARGNSLLPGEPAPDNFRAEALRQLELARDLEKSGVDIRPFRTSDLSQVAEILAASFDRRFGKTALLAKGPLQELLVDFGFASPQESPGYMVAEKNGLVLGLIRLRSPNSGEEKPALGPWERAVKYGISTSARAVLGKLLTEKGLDPHESYIEQLAVRQEEEGKGIAAALLQKAKDIASLLPGCRRLTIAVPEPDMKSIALCENLDFTHEYCDSSLVGFAFLGIPQWNFMQMPLGGGNSPEKARASLPGAWLQRRKKLWWLGFLGFVSIAKFPDMAAYFDGNTSGWSFLHLFWLWYFRYFFPRKR